MATMLLLLLLVAMAPSADALVLPYDPRLCYILDGFLGLYGLIITGMFIKEKFFRTKVKGAAAEDSLYQDLRNPDSGGYAPLMRDAERGKNRRVPNDDTYTGLRKQSEGEYKEIHVRKEPRQKRNDPLYQGLSAATRDTYDSLQMQPLPGR